MILFIDFEKFKVYNEFKFFKNNLNGLSKSEPNPQDPNQTQTEI